MGIRRANMLEGLYSGISMIIRYTHQVSGFEVALLLRPLYQIMIDWLTTPKSGDVGPAVFSTVC